MTVLSNQEHKMLVETLALLNVVLVKIEALEKLRPSLAKLSGQVATPPTEEDEHAQHIGATTPPPRLVTVDGLPQYQIPAIPAATTKPDETYPDEDFDWMDIAIATRAN